MVEPRITNYEDDSRHNGHILKLWAEMLKNKFPQISHIEITQGHERHSLIIKSEDTNGLWACEVHTESYKNFTQGFRGKGRIAVQYWEDENKKIYGKKAIMQTPADYFLHGFRDSDPAGSATMILHPIFYNTAQLKAFVASLEVFNPPYPEKPYFKKYGVNSNKTYEGFRVWSNKTINGKRVRYPSIGVLLPVADIAYTEYKNPFHPTLLGYSA